MFRVVLANDLSPTACEAMRLNVNYNGVGEPAAPSDQEPQEEKPSEEAKQDAPPQPNDELPNGRRSGCRGRVRVNEGDAM